MKRVVLAAMAATGLVFSAFSAQAGDAAGGKNFVDTVAKDVLAIVQNKEMSKDDQQTKIESLFNDKVDINFVAKFVLGKNWRAATPEQQRAYIAAYKPFILRNYASRLTKYSGQTYTLKNARSDEDATIVTMEINDPDGQNIVVDYRLTGSGGGYKIVDIIVEGVSLLTTQRAEFNGIVERKGVDGLIEALKSQVASKK